MPEAVNRFGIFASARPDYAHNVLDAGFYVVDTHPHTHHGWIGPEEYDYTLTDQRIESYLKQSADFRLIIRFWMGYNQERGRDHPFWWSKLHPEEVVLSSSGTTGVHIPDNVSFASRLFREEAGEALCRVTRHME